MITYLIAILEKAAVPFCYYDNPYYYSKAEPEVMSLDLLQQLVCSVQAKNIPVNFVYGRQPLPFEYQELIETINHIKIVPLSLCQEYPDGIVVIEGDDEGLFSLLDMGGQRNLILRIAPHQVASLSCLCEMLQGKYRRLNIHLVAVEHFTAAQFSIYEDELQKISKLLKRQHQANEEIEINVVSDRMLLNAMNNCNAGQQHLTVAPNGKYYICPGFYYDNEENFIGSFDETFQVEFCNSHLLEQAYAPLCTRCDAFHCKRCVYLNKKATQEINIPSKEQCLAAHIERDVSRQLLNSMGLREPFKSFSRIPDLPYRDPLDRLRRIDSDYELLNSNNESGVQGEAVGQMLELQKRILDLLQNK